MPGYTNITPGQYGIPYMKQASPASELGEARAAEITENALDGIRRALPDHGGFVVFSEGTYSGNFASGGSTTVTLAPGGNPYSLDALVAGVAIEGGGTVQWSGLPDSGNAYLYAQLTESAIFGSTQISSRQDKAWTAITATSGLTPANSLLLAVATTDGVAVTVVADGRATDLDEFADGKPYWIRLPRGSDQITPGQMNKTVAFSRFTPNGHVDVVKTAPGPAIDYVQKGTAEFTVHLTGPVPAGGTVTFDWRVRAL